MTGRASFSRHPAAVIDAGATGLMVANLLAAPVRGRRYEFKLLPDEASDRICTFEAVRERLTLLRDWPTDLQRVAAYGFRTGIVLLEEWAGAADRGRRPSRKWHELHMGLA